MKNTKMYQSISRLIVKISNIDLRLLILMYILGYLVVRSLLQNPVQLYIFIVFLALSGVYFSWFMGGRWTMYYVAFFNCLIVFVFSKMLWDQNVIVTQTVFLSKSFFIMYGMTFIFIFFILRLHSPADAKQAKQIAAIEAERRRRQNLEFMVASRKLKKDLIAQANLVKDELQLLEGAWRSNIHDIINDLSAVKERELYLQIIRPFEENIISHLRALELRLSFDMEVVSLADLSEFLTQKIENIKMSKGTVPLEILDKGWKGRSFVKVDKNKVWDMIYNVYRNSQTALDLKRIGMFRKGEVTDFKPQITITCRQSRSDALIEIIDNGGGAPKDQINLLYKEPVASRKRKDKKSGQGTLFVKFFADRMGIQVDAKNINKSGEKGLSVLLSIPIEPAEQNG